MADFFSASNPVHGSVNRGSAPGHPGTRRWETAALVHLSVLIVGTSWWFGGQSNGARQALLAWGTVGIFLFVAAWIKLRSDGAMARSPLRHLWPLLAFDALVIVSCFNPSTRLIASAGEQLLLHVDPRWSWLPSSARPDLSWRELWLLNGIVISCYNAFLLIHHRRVLRRLLAVVAANALLLAVLGTFQKLTAAKGLWFGVVASPQPFFFSTFIYHNHWGAFTVLNVAACLALLFHALRQGDHRDHWHSPAPLGAVAILFLAATAPLSGSRSTTVVLTVLLLGAMAHFLFQLVRQRRENRRPVVAPVAAILLAGALALAGIAFLSGDVIRSRVATTTQQLTSVRSEDTLNSRLQLYRDTWRMAADKPWFGWGLESYRDVFPIYNTQRPRELWFLRRVYREAHNDWLQSLAETGFTGTGLLVALGLAPLVGVPWRRVRSLVPRYLLAGVGLLLLYAWVEFPFANPSVLIGFWLSIYLAARHVRLDLDAQRP